MAAIDKTHLKVGDKAPGFEVRDQDGNIHRLADYSRDKLVLFFYPKDNTPGCTAEACNLRDNHGDLKKEGYRILGISADSEEKHQKFITKYQLPFPLLSDPDKEMIRAYGVWGRKKFMGKEYEGIIRTTFVVENGVISNVIEKVKTKDHAAQIMP